METQTDHWVRCWRQDMRGRPTKHWLTVWREQYTVSLRDLEKRSGINRGRLSMYENGLLLREPDFTKIRLALEEAAQD